MKSTCHEQRSNLQSRRCIEARNSTHPWLKAPLFMFIAIPSPGDVNLVAMMLGRTRETLFRARATPTLTLLVVLVPNRAQVILRDWAKDLASKNQGKVDKV